MSVFFLIVFLVMPLLFVFSVNASSSVRLYPTADSWVEAEYPNDNHGTDTSLRVKSNSRTRRSYLKFDLSSIPNGKSVISVKLYLYCTYADANPSVEIYVHETGDGWTESTITWNNAPAVGASITSVSVGGTGKYYCWDITPYGQAQYSGDKILSVVVKLLLDDPSQNNPSYTRYFASKEYSGTGQDPYLEVIYENTPPTALFTYSPTYPVANETVTFDASGSYDPDGSIVSYTWDFGDGNITTVTTPVIGHEFITYSNYTVTLTVTDDNGLSGSYSKVVEVVDPAILRVYLPEGVYVKKNTGDPWIDEGWLLNKTGNSWSFTLKIYDTSKCVTSYDTHLVVALNDAAYNNLQTLTINGTSIPKSTFKNGKPKPYDKGYWPNCVYPTWFNDTYINVGTILPKGTVSLTVSVTFSGATGARMHFDAYGSVVNRKPCSWTEVAYSPSSEDSTVLYQAAPQPLTVSITPTSAIIDLGQYITFNSIVSGGTPPYSYQWYLNGSAVIGANQSSWIFTPSIPGYYLVHLNVTDNVGNKAESNVAGITVNPPISVSIQPISSVIVLGESVKFTSTVSGGTLPYSYQWYLNDTAVSGANDPSWNFTPTEVGYYLVCLKVTDGSSAVALSNEVEVTVNPKTYTLTIITTAGGTTTPCPGTYTYVEGTLVLVAAIPYVNYNFGYWELDGAYYGTNNPTTVLMDKNHTLKAFFAVITRTLTITATTGGTTSPAPGTYVYVNGTYATVTAIPSANYLFHHWILDGSPAGSVNPINVLMDRDHNLHAVFAIINYTLTITTTSGGTTNPSPGTYVYASGSTVQVLAIPNVNYKFVRWELNGNNITTNPITILMNKSYTLHAVFAPLTYKLTILSSTGGTTNPAPGTYTYPNGTYASVTAIPDANYLFDHWLLDGNPAGSANPINILMTDDHTLQPIFVLRNYTLTITTTAGGTTNPASGVYTYPAGTVVQVTAIPNTGYRFDYWVLDGSPAGSANPISITMNNDHTLQAVFAEIHILTIAATAGGTTNPTPGTYTYNVPTNVTVTAIPYSNYYFDHWEYDSVNIGSANPITIYVGSVHNLRAVFMQIKRTLIIETTAGGTTNPTSGTYTYSNGTTVQVAAIPSPGYQFDYWVLDGSPAGSVNPINVLMDRDHTLKAVFKIAQPPPPFGGRSFSLAKPAATISIATYFILVALFATALSFRKRKRK
ncbi:MAG: DNRLRE domain-containing protein [Candidatus Bathyarchaeia archaeon]